MRRSTSLVLTAGLLLCASDAMAQRGPGRGGDRQERSGERDDQQIKPYDEVITEGAETSTGLFTVHRIDDKIYYEIPADAFGKDMLWVTTIEKTQAGFGYGGTSVGDLVVRWELRGEKVLLRDVKYAIRSSDEDDSVTHAVEATSVNPIIRAFDVEAWGKDKAPVIEVTDLFTGDLDEFSPARRLNASGVDSSRTFLEEIKTFPENINTKVLKTYRVSGDAGGGGRRGGRGGGNQSAVTVLMHYSMVVLPEAPMQPREHDDRVGFFTVRFQDFGTGEHEVDEVRYVTRWRLEKQDPEAEVSDPIKPIVFHVGRGVPDKWRPYVHKGIEMWQPAFEAAGFSNAIIARDAPSVREDPDWDAEDARISSIRWMPSTTENAMGPHVHDPRTGEILESDIIMYHNVLKLCRDWYFVQASPSDERAQKLPMPDDLLGELLAYVVAHEVGHTLGFPHNMKASSSFTVEQLRDPEFTAQHGTESSIMDYGRFNYVAQPGDGAHLIPKIGPYDFFAVEWGYREFDRTNSPEEDKEHLAAIVARQKENHMLLFGDPDGVDPGAQTEDLSGEPILATQLGLQNIDRVLGYLVEATCKEGENYDLLDNMYGEVVGQRNRELGHVTTVVAGVTQRNFWYGDADRIYHPVSPEQQRQAVQFLLNNAFTTPESLIDQNILARLEPNGAADRIVSGQRRLLDDLLDEDRIERMAELVEQNGGEGYLPIDMLEELRTGIWNELEGYPVQIDLYRRNLHRAHVEVLAEALKTESPETDLPALARDQLERIHQAILACEEKEKDATTEAHLKDLGERISQMLEGTFIPAAAEPAATGGGRFGGD